MIVVSKYFGSRCKSDMDESLSDFQEPERKLKSTHTKPKLTKVTKTKQNRRPKLKGQKDIRNILKAKSNDLVKYTEDFNSVCQQSGLDVDSEQLQIAVALSKSEQVQLQDSSELQESLPLESLTSQERTKQIRTTLLEYGFKVPDIKINFNINKKGRRLKKDSKLLKITDEERKQKISVKYAKVLFNNLNSINYSQETSSDIHSEIYSKATHAKYESLKNDNFFMINNLLKKSVTCIGSLLKDWSEIPGRPQSPYLKIEKLSFPDLLLSESELDVLLSGTFACVKKIITDKQNFHREKESLVLENENKQITCFNVDMKLLDSKERKNLPDIEVVSENNMDYPIASVNVQHRSSSPDIFEDESLCVVENTPMKPIKFKCMKAMDKENIKILQPESESIDVFSLPSSQKSDDGLNVNNLKENVTKRISNDFMDLTECVAVDILAQADVDHDEKNNKITHDNRFNNTHASDISFSIERHNTNTKSDDYMETTKCVSLSCPVESKNFSQSNCIKTENVILAPSQNVYTECVDLTENDNYSDNVDNSTIIYEYDSINSDTYTNVKEKSSQDLKKLPNVEINNKTHPIEHVDLTQESRSTSPADNPDTNKVEDFAYNHLDHNSSENSEVVDLKGDSDNKLNENNRNDNFFNISKVGNNDRFDPEEACIMTRKNSAVDCLNHTKNEFYFLNNKSPLCDSVSIAASSSSSKSVDVGLNDQETISSQSSQIVFEISDEELDYSIRECGIETFSTSDTVLNIHDGNYNSHFTQFNSSYNAFEKESKPTLNRSHSDSCLPIVEIKGIDKKTKSPSLRNNNKSASLNSTPVKIIHRDVLQSPKKVKTPKNSDYIIKTSEVTPILDYDSLSTPERLKELDKYGLKRFKRKRAIQILKHLYNQTHPIMENLSNDNLSPSKRRKTSGSPLKKKYSHKEIVDCSPIRKCTSNRLEKQNIFVITNEVLVVKEVDCHPDDWVFQKREKAKVHTCKLPLHIAFHNYVSSRYALREAILQYQPIDIDIIHKELAEDGHKYDPKDLLRFLDKKCITVKTSDNIKRKRR